MGRARLEFRSRLLPSPELELSSDPKILMLTPYKSRWGTCILQTWTLGFNATWLVGLKVPTWVTPKDVPDEFLNVPSEMARRLDECLGSNEHNSVTIDQRFCVGLILEASYMMKLGVTNESAGKKEVILVDYCNLLIRCSYCLSTEHLIKDFPGVTGKVKIEVPLVEKSSLTSQQSSGGTHTVFPLASKIWLGDNLTI